ncbi:CBS domain-containing protein, partial [Streptomyces sp. NPDC001282]
MRHRTVAELMTHDVVRARHDLPFKEIARLLAANDVTAVPVVDEQDRPIGVVSEADLLRKSADRADPSGLAPVPHLEAWERAKAEGARAEELMSAPAVCARPEWTVV